MDNRYDVIIIGGGPAGMSAAVYAGRSGLKTAMLEKEAPGGKMIKTHLVENYPGIDKIGGVDLSMKMFEHATAYGTEYLYGDVVSVDREGDMNLVKTSDGSVYETLVVIVATGTNEKTLGFEQDEKLLGRGLSYCAVCDGAFFKNDKVIVIGGGNSALEEAVYLTQFADEVNLVIRRDVFRGDPSAQRQVLNNSKINVIRKHIPVDYIIDEHNKISGMKFENVDTQEELIIEANGVFPYIGAIPATSFLQGKGVLDDEGYLVVNEKLESAIPGVFGAGDVIPKHLRQIVTATSDGAITAQNAFSYIQDLKSKA